jgi:hypothetical protein
VATAARTGAPAAIAPNAAATAVPKALAVPVFRNGNATTTVLSSPGWATAGTRLRMAEAARRTRLAARSATPCALAGESGSPTGTPCIFSARCQSSTVEVSAASAAVASRVSLTVGREKYRFGPVSSRSSIGADGADGADGVDEVAADEVGSLPVAAGEEPGSFAML